MTDEKVIATHALWTAPGSFYRKNQDRFKGQKHMTYEEELAYIRAALVEKV